MLFRPTPVVSSLASFQSHGWWVSSTRAGGFAFPEGSVNELLGIVLIGKQVRHVSFAVLIEGNRKYVLLSDQSALKVDIVESIWPFAHHWGFDGVNDVLRKRFDGGEGILMEKVGGEVVVQWTK